PDGVISYSAAQNYARRMKRKAKRAAELHVPVSEIAAVVEAEDAAVVAAAERERRQLVTAGVVQSDPTADDANGLERHEVLAVHGLHAGYDDVEVLHGIDLTLHAGVITVLLGANGSGKTTLCSTVSGVVP